MHMMIVKAIADGSGPDITGRIVPMPAGSYHLCREDDRSWFEQRSDVFSFVTQRDDSLAPTAYKLDANGNVTGLVGPDGEITLDEFATTLPSSVQMLAATVDSAWSTPTLPTPYSAVAGHVLHASPLYFPAGFGGYKYWAAYTPYPNGDAAYENPCIAASNDFETWVLPTGAPNPLVERPTAPGYNADTNLYYDAPTKKLVVLWRERNAAGNNLNILKLITTSDGATWSSPVSIWSGSITNNDMASPSLFYDTAASKYTIIAHNLDDSSRPIRKITSSSLLSGWDETPTTLTFAAPAGRKWWHSQFLYLSSSAVVGVAQDNDGTAGASGKLYFVYSADGATFYYRLFDPKTTWYKPGLLLRRNQDGTPLVQLMLSKTLSSVVYTGTATIKRRATLAAEASALGSALQTATSAPSAVLWGDDFNRSDSSSAIGTALSGGTYTQHGAGSDVIGINTNRAYNATSNNCRASADVLAADYEARVVFASPGTQGFLMFRFTDTSNYFRVGNTSLGGNLAFQEVTAGSLTTSMEIGSTVVAGDIITVRCAGSLLQVLHNGDLVHEAHDASNLSATRVGLQASGATPTYFDALTVTRF